MDDFCRCTPEEFGSVCSAWHSQRDSDIRDRWERMRLQTVLLLQPYSRGPLKSVDVLPLPWDNAPGAGEREGSQALSRSAQRERMESLVRRMQEGAQAKK